MTELLFVYGTLRRDDASGRGSLLGIARSLGGGVVAGKLFTAGGYPGAVPGSGKVRGEVYELKDFDRQIVVLDRYEACDAESPEPREYRREETEVTLDSGAKLRVWIYWYAWVTDELPEIASGDWLVR